MKRNKGISLIVLVITIIVMIILAGAIIITLNNNGIIDEANEAVKEYNLDEVEQVASLAWAEAYLNGARTQKELKTAVKSALTANKITEVNYEGYELEVTTSGVKLVKIIAPGLYETGSNYTVMLMSWDELVTPRYCESCFLEEQYVYVDDAGKVSSSTECYPPYGDLALPNDVSIIELDFFNRYWLTGVMIPGSVTSVSQGAFDGCINLTSVTIQDGVTSIESNAFRGCDSLTSITYNGTIEEWNAIKLYDDNALDTWNSFCGEITVTCTDGTVVIPAWTEPEA